MVSIVILLRIRGESVSAVGDRLTTFEAVKDVYSVTGPWDLVAIARVHTSEEMAELVATKIRGLEGVEQSETMVGDRIYSHHDLERMFSIGLDRPGTAAG